MDSVMASEEDQNRLLKGMRAASLKKKIDSKICDLVKFDIQKLHRLDGHLRQSNKIDKTELKVM